MNGRLPMQELTWLRQRLERGLHLLAQAQRYVELDALPREQFAVKSRELAERGLSECDLTWLLSQELVQHFVELTLADDSQRRFRPGGVVLGACSCFLLTAEGCGFLQEFYGPAPTASPTPSARERPILPLPAAANEPEIPHWDADRQELTYLGRLVKRYRLPSPNQTAILSAFAEEGWPARIDDPLSPHGDQDPKRRLHDTIRNLNRAQSFSLLRFVGDGSGQGVLWERAS